MYLKIIMTDNSVWYVPARVVAMNFAEHYSIEAGIAGSLERQIAYEKELASVMEDTFQLLDWAENNMEWSELVGSAVKYTENTKPDYDAWYNKADLSIVSEKGD